MTAPEPQELVTTTPLACPVWKSPPEPLDTPSHVVDIWRIRLPQAHHRECSHAARMTILRCYLGSDQAFELGRQSGGKPYLAPLGSGPEFNLSHTGGLALLAVSPQHPVGIDIERVRHLRDPLRIAKRVLPSNVTARLNQLHPDQLRHAFFNQWTRFEAIQKSAGRGVFEAPIDAKLVDVYEFCPFDGFVACIAVLTREKLTFRHFNFRES